MDTELDILKDTYEIIEKIGTGGGGDVYKAFHKRLRTEVIIKKVHSNIVGKVNTRAEADILKNLKSPYLPKVLDYIEVNGSVFTVMEYIPGKSLQKLLDEGESFGQKRVLKWARQLAEAVNYLHSQNPPIIHSDIKPDNIMLTPDDDICLIDFNISLSAEKGKAAVAGITNGYSPPEQYPERFRKAGTVQKKKEDEATVLMGDEATVLMEDTPTEVLKDNVVPKANPNVVLIDARADIYSMGATIYHLLTGKKPETSLGAVTPVGAVKEKKISEGMIHIVSKAMEKNPARRFQSAEDMLKMLLNIHKMDKRYKSFRRSREIVYSLLVILLSASIISIKFGIDKLEQEKEEKYTELIVQAGDYIESEQYELVEGVYKQAVKLYSDRNAAYHQKALALYRMENYESCIQFISDYVLTNSKLPLDDDMAEIYYILGNSYFETENYASADIYFHKAININDGIGKYYRDYAVSLARNGETEQAKMIVEEAIAKGLSESDLHYVNCELSYMESDYQGAVSEAKLAVDMSEDDYIKARAYIIQSKSYKEMSKTDASMVDANINILKEAADKLPASYTIAVLNMLAQEYIDSDRNTEAIAVLNTLINNGQGTYSLYYSKAILYQKEQNFAGAYGVYEEMIDRYGENYEIYKRMAFLEAEVQMSLENKNRDYKKFVGHYEKACELYTEVSEKKPDDEMNTLKILYEDIKAGGWLEE